MVFLGLNGSKMTDYDARTGLQKTLKSFKS